MAYTKLTGTSVGIVMDDAFFARSIELSSAWFINPGGMAGDDFSVGFAEAPHEGRTDPYPRGVGPQYGLFDLFGTGDSVFIVYLSAQYESDLSYDVKYFDFIDPPKLGDLSLNDNALQSVVFSDQQDPVLLHDLIGGSVGLLYDREAANIIKGSYEADELRGFGGKDLIAAGGGSDIIFGGSGNDTLSSYAILSSGGIPPYDQPPFDTHPSSNDGGADRLYGEKGNDELYGDNGIETLDGGKGNDLLVGYAGNDKLDGGDGDDTLNGGVGRDVLKGGAGADGFFYKNKAGEGGDKITDFNPANDSILISAGGFQLSNYGLSTGDDLGAAGRFASNTQGNGTVVGFAQFVYDSDDGKLYWDADGKGGAPGTLLATLTGAPTLTAADLVIVA